ncbi:MAG: SPFH domain-containing protein, partial [Chitinophagales bacterium]
MMSSIPLIIIIVLALSVILSGLVTVQQGNIAVVTMFGKYRRMLPPGLNFKIPFVEQIFKRISIQNRSAELEFTAITIDQANVNFKAMLLYAVLDATDESIKNVAFKFIDDRNFMQALVRSI